LGFFKWLEKVQAEYTWRDIFAQACDTNLPKDITNWRRPRKSGSEIRESLKISI
jgi:hypothetical protein